MAGMKASRDPLWQRLSAFELDEPGVALSFSKRLARENGWSREFSQRVVEEYRRFIFLAVRAGHPVTPSDSVDQAWHLHLVYTRSYWEGLCGEVLGQPLHHGPTRGGQAEAVKFEDWYARTQASYEAWFGAPPPEDVWPCARLRFDAAARWRRVDAGAHWLVPKKAVARVAAMVALAGCSVVLAACSGAMTDFSIFSMYAAFIVALGLTLRTVFRAAARGRKRGGSKDHRHGCGYYGGTGCSSGCGSSRHDSSHSSHSDSSDSSSSSDSGSSGCGSSGCGGGGCGGGGD